MANKDESKVYSNILIKEIGKRSDVNSKNKRKSGSQPVQRDRRIHTKGYSSPKT